MSTTGAEIIIKVVAAFYDIPMAELLGARRWANLVTARQLAAYLIRERYGTSLPQLGRLLGKRDHTTILKGLESLDKKLAADPDLRRQLYAIEGMLERRLPRTLQELEERRA